MADDLVKRMRAVERDYDLYDHNIIYEAADRIEALERELAEERHSREIAAAKAWELSDRIKELEKKNDD
jgi:hypothetical protein